MIVFLFDRKVKGKWKERDKKMKENKGVKDKQREWIFRLQEAIFRGILEKWSIKFGVYKAFFNAWSLHLLL